MEAVTVTASIANISRGSRAIIDDGKNKVRMVQMKDGRFFLRFYSPSAFVKAFLLKEGREYLVWPTYAKPHVPVETDTYWPRRWANEFGGPDIRHKQYFVFVEPDANNGEPIRLRTSAKGTSPRCYVNKEWFKTATYDEFCWQLNLPQRRSLYRRKLLTFVNRHVIEPFEAGRRCVRALVSDRDCSFYLHIRATCYCVPSVVITQKDGSSTAAHGNEQVPEAIVEAIWRHTHEQLEQFGASDLARELRFAAIRETQDHPNR